ncbi:MAG: hypothetical protein R3Y28_08450 [Candidatus Gastranaerophilales bacterium]
MNLMLTLVQDLTTMEKIQTTYYVLSLVLTMASIFLVCKKLVPKIQCVAYFIMDNNVRKCKLVFNNVRQRTIILYQAQIIVKGGENGLKTLNETTIKQDDSCSALFSINSYDPSSIKKIVVYDIFYKKYPVKFQNSYKVGKKK